jgi:hypothetical protein
VSGVDRNPQSEPWSVLAETTAWVIELAGGAVVWAGRTRNGDDNAYARHNREGLTADDCGHSEGKCWHERLCDRNLHLGQV